MTGRPTARGFVATDRAGQWRQQLVGRDARRDRRARPARCAPIAQPETQINFPRVSPDGKTVAFIGGLMSDFGSVGGDVWTVPFAGGDAGRHHHRATRRRSPRWRGLKGGLRATRLMGADASVVAAIDGQGRGDVAVEQARRASRRATAKVAFSADGADGRDAWCRISSMPPAIYAGPRRRARARSRTTMTRCRALVTARSITWKNDGYRRAGLAARARATPIRPARRR